MAAQATIETIFLREFAVAYVSEISFTPEAEADIKRCRELGLRVGLADVLYVFQNGEVTKSEKTNADGAEWQVTGETCHGDNLVVNIHVWCDRYRARVLKVTLMGDKND